MGICCEIYGIDETEIIRIEGKEDAMMEFYKMAEDKMDLNKSWMEIHHFLSCFAPKGNPIIKFFDTGGRPIPGSDTGYGEARYFSPSEVKAINNALSILDPFAWDDEIITDIFTSLMDFIRSLSSRGKAMLIWFS